MLKVGRGVIFIFQVVAEDAGRCGVEHAFFFARNYGGVFKLPLLNRLVMRILDGPIGTIQVR